MITNIAGIPCQVELTWIHSQPALGPMCDSDWDCYGYTDIEFDVLDRKGYKAPWLERKMTLADKQRIDEELLETLDEAY
jgi:hypothetical protein